MATTTRIPIKLSPHFYGDASTTSSSYHAIHQEASNAHVNLAGSNLLTATNNSGGNSTNNGSNSNTLELNTADGTSLRGHMNNADDHDCVLLYDEASQSYILHHLSSVSHLLPSSSGGSSKNLGVTSSTDYTPSITTARTPQSTNSPSIGTGTASASATTIAAKKGSPSVFLTKKKQSNHSGYDSSPTPNKRDRIPSASYGLGISTSNNDNHASPHSNTNANANVASGRLKGKAPVRDIEEFDVDMSGAPSSEDEDLLVNALELPPAQGSLQIPQANTKPPIGSKNPPPSKAASQQSTSITKQSSHQSASSTSSTSTTLLSKPANKHQQQQQDIVMSSSEDENDFDDLANVLESSLAGNGIPTTGGGGGPFARIASGTSTTAGAGGTSSIAMTNKMGGTIVSSEDEDEDEEDEDEDDDDFVNAFQTLPQVQTSMTQQASQVQPSAPQQQQQPAQVRAVQPANTQRPAQAAQAGKKLPTTSSRKYDSDIASSSESDDD